jgi:hypothetical protein
MLSMILSDKPYKPLGAPPVLIRGNVSTLSRDLNTSQVGYAYLNLDEGLIRLLERWYDKNPRVDYLGSHHPW